MFPFWATFLSQDTSSSSLSGVQIGLITSVVIIGIGAIISVIVIRKKINKIRAKMKHDATIPRVNSGETDPHLKKHFPKQIDDLDLEFLLNTIYRNKYKKILVVGPQTEYLSLAFQKQTVFPLEVTNADLDQDKILEIQGELTSYKDFSFKKEVKEEEKFELIYVNKMPGTYESIYKKYLESLVHYGMLIIQDTISSPTDALSLSKHLKSIKIPHELKKIKTKMFLVVKNFK